MGLPCTNRTAAIIIMYIYHALMIHINLNIFYTHVKHSPTKTIYIKYYKKINKNNNNKNALQTHTHACTHTYTDCSRNWVLLGWKYCEKRKVFSLALNGDTVEQCLRSCGSEFQMWGPKQEKEQKH